MEASVGRGGGGSSSPKEVPKGWQACAGEERGEGVACAFAKCVSHAFIFGSRAVFLGRVRVLLAYREACVRVCRFVVDLLKCLAVFFIFVGRINVGTRETTHSAIALLRFGNQPTL